MRYPYPAGIWIVAADIPFEVMDETTYSFCLTFSDGSQCVTYDAQEKLEDFSYRLAENAD